MTFFKIAELGIMAVLEMPDKYNSKKKTAFAVSFA